MNRPDGRAADRVQVLAQLVLGRRADHDAVAGPLSVIGWNPRGGPIEHEARQQPWIVIQPCKVFVNSGVRHVTLLLARIPLATRPGRRHLLDLDENAKVLSSVSSMREKSYESERGFPNRRPSLGLRIRRLRRRK